MKSDVKLSRLLDSVLMNANQTFIKFNSMAVQVLGRYEHRDRKKVYSALVLTILTHYYSQPQNRSSIRMDGQDTPIHTYDGSPILQVDKVIGRHLAFGYEFTTEEIDLLSINLLGSGDKLFKMVLGKWVSPPVIERVYPDTDILTLADGTKLLERIPGTFIKVDHGDGTSIYKVGN